jgi:predicted nuclease of predicted toxin-antitoxin system
MKLLFDQNISFRVIKSIIDLYPDAKQVRELNLENAADHEIWSFANQEGYAIVTFDSDFYDLTLIRGIPPKIIWLRLGNTNTADIITTFRENIDLIQEFLTDPEYKNIGCLEISR